MLKIIHLILYLGLLFTADTSYAKRKNISNYVSSDITQSPKYASLIVNSKTGEVLHKHNAHLKRHPASLTKMMTIYLGFHAVKSRKLSLNTQIPVSKWASSQIPTKLWLKPGQKITVKDALYGMIIHSANDASVVLAEAISGSEEAFAYKMTQTARQLGMHDTTFRNAHGLHHFEQVTTALDMAKLGIALRRDFPEFYHMFSKKSFVFRGSVINGHNRVLNRYRWADGLKTGYTTVSGSNLVTTASRPEGKIIAVVLGGPSAIARDNHMITLLDKGFDKLASSKHVRYAQGNRNNLDKFESNEHLIAHNDATNPLNAFEISDHEKEIGIDESSHISAFEISDYAQNESINSFTNDLNQNSTILVNPNQEVKKPILTKEVKPNIKLNSSKAKIIPVKKRNIVAAKNNLKSPKIFNNKTTKKYVRVNNKSKSKRNT